MLPRRILVGTVSWQDQDDQDEFGARHVSVVSGREATLSGLSIRKTQLQRENAELFCSALCKQVSAPPGRGMGISKLIIVHFEDGATSDTENAERRRDFWSAYFGVSNKTHNGLEKFEMQAAIARTARVDKDLIAFDVARSSFPGIDEGHRRIKLETVLRAWVQLCNAQLDTSESGSEGAASSSAPLSHVPSSFNTENDGRSGGIGMVYKQSLAATAAPLLMVAGWDEVLATAFLWKLTCRHRGLFQSIDEPGTPGSVIVHNGNPLFQEYNLVQQMHYTASLLMFWDPALAQRVFVELNVHPSMFMVPWLEAFFSEIFAPEDLVSIMDLIVSLGCYDRRVCAYIAAAVLISLRSKLMDREVMSQDWQALQFFSRLNGGAVQVDMNQVRVVALQICQCTPASLAPRPPDEDSDLTLGQLVPILRSLDEVQDLGREHACVLHIVFRNASKGPLMLGQMERLSAQLLPQELLHLPVFAIDSAEILRDGVLAGTDLTTRSKATHSKLREAFAALLVRKCRGIMAYKGRMVLICVDQQKYDENDHSAASQQRLLAQRVCVLLSRCYFPNACMVQPLSRGLSSAATRYAAAVEEHETTHNDVGQFVSSSDRVSMRVSKSESVFLESVEMGGIQYMRLGDGHDEDEDEDDEEK
eukprot:INCI14389.2.p1 GENE.INCI14389.2~~INCI14389.2.p1  ORF type:complete len:646 (-),score=92.51 INCI14389.2:316-2253(-)